MRNKRFAIVLLLLLFFSYIFPIISYANLASIRYQVHLKDFGWINVESDGQVAGTTGQCRRMEAIAIATSNLDGKLTYQVHTEDYGWLPISNEGSIAGTTGECKRMEAIIIYLENSTYNIKYRVHIQDYGWLDWVENGQVAGTTGESKRIEAIQIKLEKMKKDFNIIVQNEITDIDSYKNKQLGIDVSKYQGHIDWAKVKKAGIQFAMIRCGYRGYTEGKIYEDANFYENVKGAYNNGIDVGVYFYSSAINESEAYEEANFAVQVLDKYDFNDYISYPIVIDVEDFEGTRSYNISKQTRTNIVKAFCNEIQNNGFDAMIYSYTYFLENSLYIEQLQKYNIWIADYYGNIWYNRPYIMWQFTDKGKIDGIDGYVDLNYKYY